MNYKSILWFSKKSGNDSRKKIVIPIVLCSIIVVSIFSFNQSIMHYLYDGIMKSFYYNYYFITYTDSGDSRETVMKNLKQMNHVVDVFEDDYQMYSLYLEKIANNNVNGSFYLVGTTNEYISKAFNLNVNLENNNIICPRSFYPNDNIEGNRFISAKNIISMNNMVNQNIDAYYYRYINDYDYEKQKIKLKVIDTYSNNDSLIDENICYVSRSIIKNIFDDAYKNLDLSNQTGSIIISIDNQDNYKNIEKQINDFDYEISGSFVLNDNFLSFIKRISYVLIFGSIVFVLIFTFNFNKKRLIDRTKEFGILRSIGSTKRNISKILIVETCITFMISIICSLIFIIIISSILRIIITIYPFIFDKIPITINFMSFIIYMLSILFILIIESFLFAKKIFKQDILLSINE